MFIAPADYSRQITVIVDHFPGFDMEAATRLCDFIAANGYAVAKVTVDELLATVSPSVGLGFLLLIPCAASLPVECAPVLKKFNRQGGKLLTLGGPLFNHIIKRVDGAWHKEPVADSALSALTSVGGETGSFRLEGICPPYKVFMVEKAASFDRHFVPAEPLDVVCPVPRPLGAGFGNERENRFVPLVQIADGRRGAAAFMMLSDTKDRCEETSGIRPGAVSAEVVGSVSASIGLRQQDLLSVPGADKALLEILKKLECGLFLFEGGSESFVFRPGEEMTLGARVLNSTHDFHDVQVHFTLKSASGKIVTRDVVVPAIGQNIASVSFRLQLDSAEEYTVVTEIPGIDRIEHKLLPLPPSPPPLRRTNS